MEECKTEVEVRRWAKINGYTGEGIEKAVEKWKTYITDKTIKDNVQIQKTTNKD